MYRIGLADAACRYSTMAMRHHHVNCCVDCDICAKWDSSLVDEHTGQLSLAPSFPPSALQIQTSLDVNLGANEF